MGSNKQNEAAKKNIKKAQKKWQSMSPRQRALAQPQDRDRAKPGTKGKGEYYRIVVRPKTEFTTFRYHDVGEDNGDLQRLAGRRSSGSWDTQAWLVDKDSAHVVDGKLIGDTKDVLELLAQLRNTPVQIKGDIFKAKSRKNVAEKDKPTKAQKSTRQENIKKAQEARWV